LHILLISRRRKGSRQRSEVRGQKTEVRRQETEGRGQIEGWRVGGLAKNQKGEGIEESSGKRNSWLFMVIHGNL